MYRIITQVNGMLLTSTPYSNFTDAYTTFKALRTGEKQGRDRVQLFRCNGGAWHILKDKPRINQKLPPIDKGGNPTGCSDLLCEQPIPAWATR